MSLSFLKGVIIMNNNTVVEGKRIDEIGKDAAGEWKIAGRVKMGGDSGKI